ncbi:two-CW domain-containing protein [Candidatus Neomarinimicrobiota bacterium]
MKTNCWDYMDCGREIDGVNEATLGSCPAWTYWTFHGINHGTRGGRYCWNVAGTFREGKPLCTHAAKFKYCNNCDFYCLVQSEEGNTFVT